MKRAAIVLLAVLPACSDFLKDTKPDPCAQPTPSLTGTWEISASGVRTTCDVERFQGRFGMTSKVPLKVALNGNALALSEPVPGFTLTGTARGLCVTLTATEDFEGDRATYTLTMEASSSDRSMTGKLSGSGPARCSVNGDAKIAIR